MGWSGWEEFGNLTTPMMITKRKKTTANNQPKQSIPPTDTPLVRLAGVSTTAALAAQPLTSAEFLRELQQQRAQRGTSAAVEELAEAIMAAATPAPATEAPASPPRARGHTRSSSWASTCIWIATWWCGKSMAARPSRRNGSARASFWSGPRNRRQLAQQVYSCYEAGPFGYSLHRKLKALGITNYVIRPRDWDEYGKKVKTDKRDAKADGAAVWTGMWPAITRRSASCACPPKPKSKPGAARASGRACRRRSNGWRPRDAATPCITARIWRATGGLEGLWKELVVPPIVLELLEPLAPADPGAGAGTQDLDPSDDRRRAGGAADGFGQTDL